MRASNRILLTFAGAVAAAAVLAPAVKPAADALVQRQPWARKTFRYYPRQARRAPGVVRAGSYDFARVFRYLVLATLLGGLALQARSARIGEALRRGFAAEDARLARLGGGLAVGVVSVAGLLLLLWLCGARHPRPWAYTGATAKFWRKLVQAPFSAAIPGVAEECVFRGILLGALLRERRVLTAVVIADAVYVAFHFLGGTAAVSFGPDPWVGLRTAGECVGFSLSQAGALAKALGLLSVGAVLCLALARSGSLYLGIGLHTGWVFAIKVANLLFWAPVAPEDRWLYGSRWLVDGLFVWLLAIPVGAYVWWLTRPRGDGAGPTTPA